MNDELDKLQQAFTEEPEIKPSSEAKKAAINVAMAAFEAEKAKNLQGNHVDSRLKEQDNKLVDLLTLSQWRKSMKLTYLLQGTAGLAVIALIAVNTHQFDTLFPNDNSSRVNETQLAAAKVKSKFDTEKFTEGTGSDVSTAPAPSFKHSDNIDDDQYINSNGEIVTNRDVKTAKENAKLNTVPEGIEPGSVEHTMWLLDQPEDPTFPPSTKPVAPDASVTGMVNEPQLARDKVKSKFDTQKFEGGASSDVSTAPAPSFKISDNIDENQYINSNGEIVTNRDVKTAKENAKLNTVPESIEPGSIEHTMWLLDQPEGPSLAPSTKRSVLDASVAGMIAPQPEIMPGQQHKEQGRDTFTAIKINPLKQAQQNPVSTFSIDVDTASYSFVRASLNRNVLPPKDAVRIEELINYFPYDYSLPKDRQAPFGVSTTVMPTPWNEHTKLLHIGIKGYQLPAQTQPRANLVFLLDTSGSMNQPNKLPLLKNSFKLLLTTLSAEDTVSIVSYAGSAGTVLEPTKVKNKAAILSALSRLNAGGSTAGGEGIRLAYQLAEANFDQNGVNRVILATDGDFNVGIRNQEELKGFIERKRNSGVMLSVLGFGMGNYNDALMQALAQNGNGNAAYIDSLSEARKVLVEEASSTLFTIAKDVKIQMEFNPSAVSEYRLIGYETRQLKREDFSNDKVDAGDIGSGHSVTAIYEITPTESGGKRIDDLRYQTPEKADKLSAQTEYGFLKLRYKLPDSNTSQLIKEPVLISESFDTIDAADNDVRFAVAVAAFGQLLRGGQYTTEYGYDELIQLAQNAKGDDRFGYRSEFITLARFAKSADILQAQ